MHLCDSVSIPATSTKVSETLLGTFASNDAGSKRFLGSVLNKLFLTEFVPVFDDLSQESQSTS